MAKFRITSIPQNKKLDTYAGGGAACPRGYVIDASGKCVPYNFNDVQAADSYKGMYGGYDKKGVKNLKQEIIVAKKGKKFSDYVLRGGKTKADMAKKLGKDAGQYFGMPGEALQPTNFTKAGLEKYNKTIKDAKKNFEAEEKSREEYEKAVKKKESGKMSTDKFARQYKEKGWADKYDPATMKEGYKGQFQDAVDEANARKEANMGITNTALELFGGGAYRVAADPLGTLKGVGQTVGDIATLPFGLATGVYNYATDGNFDMGTNAWGDSYGKGLSQTGDVLSAIPGLGAAGKLAKFTKAADLAGDIGKSVKSTFQNTYKINPWAFKPNPKAAYRMIGKEGYADALESGVIRAKQNAGAWIDGELVTGKPNYDAPYFSYGKPWDRNLVKGKPHMGYKGPYMAELTNEKSLIENELAYSTGRNNIYKPTRTIQTSDANLKLYKEHWLKGYKEVPKQLPGSPNTSILDKAKQFFDRPPGPMMLLGPSGGTNMVKKNIPYYEQLLNTYDSKVMSTTNKKFYKDLISTAKKQDGMLTEAQLRELDRLKTGNFDFGKKGYAKGGITNDYIEMDIPKSKVQWYMDNGYDVEVLE